MDSPRATWQIKSLKPRQVLYICLTGDGISTEKHEKKVKKGNDVLGYSIVNHNQVIWDPSYFLRLKQSRGNYYKTMGLFYRRPWLSFTWINQIYLIRFSLQVLSCLQHRRKTKWELCGMNWAHGWGSSLPEGPKSQYTIDRVLIPRIWRQSFPTSIHTYDIIYSGNLGFKSSNS